MVQLTGTITAVTTIAGGLWALCASVFATAGWTAPACLGAGFASGVDLILGIVSDATSGSTSTSGNDPDPSSSSSSSRARPRNAVKWYKMHDDGFLEAYHGRLHELYGTNETHTMIDMRRGYMHTVSMKGDYATVETDMTQATGKNRRIRRRQAESPASAKFSRRSLGGLERRITSSESKAELSQATYQAQKVGTVTTSATESSADSIGTDIANAAWQLGTWCTSILDGSSTIADIGLTLGGPGYEPSDEEPPCEASSKRMGK